MCGAAIIAEFIRPNRGSGAGLHVPCPSDIWHDSPVLNKPASASSLKPKQSHFEDTYYTPIKAVKEEEGKTEEEEEAENREVQKLSEELMAYENYMKFFQIPYLDGQSAAAPRNPAQESVVGELWSFEDDGATVTSASN